MNFQPRPILPAAVELGAPPTHCCWPMWNDQERATHVYCGAAVALNRPYCPHHACIAFVPSGGGRFKPEDFGGKPAPQPRVLVKVNKPKPVAQPKAPPARKITNAGKALFARTLPPIDIRLCINDAGRAIVTAANAGKSQREIAKELGCTHSSVAGRCSKIRARRLEE